MHRKIVVGVSGVLTAASLVAMAGGDRDRSPAPRAFPTAWLPQDLSAFAGGDVAPRHVRLVMADEGPTFVPAADDSDHYLRTVAVMACFDPENPPSAEVMAWMEENLYAGGLSNDSGWGDNYQLGSRWSPGAQGDPYTISWSFVPDGLSISSGAGEPVANSILFQRMDTRWARATWIGYFQNCFDRWAAVSGTSYIRVTASGVDWDDGASWGTSGNDTTRGDVRISAKPIDGLSGILAYNYFPQNGDMVLDSGDMTGSSNFFSLTNSARFLRNVVQHEHGHGLGFNHVCPANSQKLMEPFISTAYDGVRHDDIRGAQRHYGDIAEPDNTAAAANTLIGTMAVGTNKTLGTVPAPLTGTAPANSSTLSIDANGEQDYFRFAVGSTPILVNVTVTPQGLNYANYAQTSACNTTTNNTNSLAMANLAVQVIDKNTTTVLAEASAAASGLAESVTGVLISPEGDFFVRVYETDTPTQSQLYTLNIVGSAAATLTATDGTFNDRVRLTWSSVPNAGTYSVHRNSTNNYNTSTQIATGLAGLTYDDFSAAANTTYWYWVTTTQGSGTNRPISNPDSGFRTTSTPPPGAFSLVSPADGSLGVGLTPTLSWTVSSDATSYTVRIADNPSLTSPLFTQGGVASTSFLVPGGVLEKCTEYYWGVQAVNSTATTNSTPLSWYFETFRPADFDGSGFVDIEDYSLFIYYFELGDDLADFDGSGFVDIEDFSKFVQAFENGC